MSMKGINSYDLPLWLQKCWEDIINESFFKLRNESEQYKDLYELCNRIADEHENIVKIVEGDAERHPMELSAEETRLLSKYLQMLADQQELEQMQVYMLGCRDMYQMLKMLDIIE